MKAGPMQRICNCVAQQNSYSGLACCAELLLHRCCASDPARMLAVTLHLKESDNREVRCECPSPRFASVRSCASDNGLLEPFRTPLVSASCKSARSPQSF